MKKEFYFNEDIASGQEITTKKGRHGFFNVVFLFPEVTNFIGFLVQFFPSVIISTEIQNKGKQQSNLFSVSAGNDLRMSTMRPNPYLSAGIEERKGKFRDSFQLFSQAN